MNKKEQNLVEEYFNKACEALINLKLEEVKTIKKILHKVFKVELFTNEENSRYYLIASGEDIFLKECIYDCMLENNAVVITATFEKLDNFQKLDSYDIDDCFLGINDNAIIYEITKLKDKKYLINISVETLQSDFNYSYIIKLDKEVQNFSSLLLKDRRKNYNILDKLNCKEVYFYVIDDPYYEGEEEIIITDKISAMLRTFNL